MALDIDVGTNVTLEELAAAGTECPQAGNDMRGPENSSNGFASTEAGYGERLCRRRWDCGRATSRSPVVHTRLVSPWNQLRMAYQLCFTMMIGKRETGPLCGGGITIS